MWLDIFFGGGCSVKASLLKTSHERSSITDCLHVVAGVRTGVADDGSSSLAASIPVGAATTGGRGRVGGTT